MTDTSAYLFVRPEQTIQFDGADMVLVPGKTLVCKGDTRLTLRRRAFSALHVMPGPYVVFCIVRPPFELVENEALVNGVPRGQYVKAAEVFIQGVEDASNILQRFALWVASQGLEWGLLPEANLKALQNVLAVKKRMSENRCTPQDELEARDLIEGQVAQFAYKLKEAQDVVRQLEASTCQAIATTIMQALNRCPEDAARGAMKEGTRAAACKMALDAARELRQQLTDEQYADPKEVTKMGMTVGPIAVEGQTAAHVAYNQRLEAMLAQLLVGATP